MNNGSDPLAIDRQFFAALIAADSATLDRLLANDFTLIDVMSGSEHPKPAFLAFVASGQVKFETIEPAENRVRLYDTTAVVTGRTRMQGRMGDAPFTASSRYTHVFARQQGQWRLVNAQGTTITPAP